MTPMDRAWNVENNRRIGNDSVKSPSLLSHVGCYLHHRDSKFDPV